MSNLGHDLIVHTWYKVQSVLTCYSVFLIDDFLSRIQILGQCSTVRFDWCAYDKDWGVYDKDWGVIVVGIFVKGAIIGTVLYVMIGVFLTMIGVLML